MDIDLVQNLNPEQHENVQKFHEETTRGISPGNFNLERTTQTNLYRRKKEKKKKKKENKEQKNEKRKRNKRRGVADHEIGDYELTRTRDFRNCPTTASRSLLLLCERARHPRGRQSPLFRSASETA